MLISRYRKKFINELLPFYDKVEAASFFYLILENYHNLSRVDLALHVDLEFTNVEIDLWFSILEKLKQEIPIQYILGKTSFFGLDFIVNENVLIPRPETEELVDWILNSEIIHLKPTLKILDIGTGSGCIAITLAKNCPKASVFAIDISAKALKLAETNAINNHVEVTFLQKNILETTDLLEEFDIIVSNPPYVRQLEKHEIKKNVLDHEPHLALFVANEDPLIFYRKIAKLAQHNLIRNGHLFFEINQYLGNETVSLLKTIGFENPMIKKDIYGNDRMIMCSKT